MIFVVFVLSSSGQGTIKEIIASRDNKMDSEGHGTLCNGRGDSLTSGVTDKGENRFENKGKTAGIHIFTLNNDMERFLKKVIIL